MLDKSKKGVSLQSGSPRVSWLRREIIKRRGKWRRNLITEKAYFQKGLAELGFVKGLAELYLLVSIYLLQKGIEPPFFGLMLLVVFLIICFRMFGKLWDRLDLYQEEAEFGNERNLLAKELREKVLK